MLYATIGKGVVKLHIHEKVWFETKNVTEVQCDGDELHRAYRILGRHASGKSVMKFVGVNAQEILLNW